MRNDPVCGLQRISRRRVTGGRSAGFGVYPWQALVLNQNSRCGGALVGRQHVVTAGHCVSNYTDTYKVPVGMKVYLGEYNLLTEKEPLPMQKRIVTKAQCTILLFFLAIFGPDHEHTKKIQNLSNMP